MCHLSRRARELSGRPGSQGDGARAGAADDELLDEIPRRDHFEYAEDEGGEEEEEEEEWGASSDEEAAGSAA